MCNEQNTSETNCELQKTVLKASWTQQPKSHKFAKIENHCNQIGKPGCDNDKMGSFDRSGGSNRRNDSCTQKVIWERQVLIIIG